MSVQILHWLTIVVLIYTFIGYPMVLAALCRLRKSGSVPEDPGKERKLPQVSIILAVRNGEAVVRARLENFLDLDYPAELMEAIVVDDASSDETGKMVKNFPSGEMRVELIRSDQRRGKAACLNSAVAGASGDILLFADVRQQFDRSALRMLVRHFNDPAVGAVSGALEIARSDAAVGEGVGAYWRLEKKLRRWESVLDSSVGCTGAIYAARRAAYEPIPGDTILDDVVIPMQIAEAGLRVRFDPNAVAIDPQAQDAAVEHRRKRRTLAGNFQMLFRYPRWMLPWKHRLWWQLISHKYMRLCAPVFLVLAFATALWLSQDHWIYRCSAILQGAVYALAVLGMLLPRARFKLLTIPAGFVFLNAMTVAGFWFFLRGRGKAGW